MLLLFSALALLASFFFCGWLQFFLGVFVTIVLFVYKKVSEFIADKEFTQTLPEFYWGKDKANAEKDDVSVVPFVINVEQKDLDILKHKLSEELNSGRITAPLEGIGFQYGFNSEELKTVGDYWLNQYDWRAREKQLNKYPQFKTKIDGLSIHFQHVKSPNNSKYKTTRPLLLLHGWPGSFVEFQKIIPLLTDPEGSDYNFELVIPSIPGYGFSEGAVRPGLGIVETGKIFLKLMIRLGHKKFYIQGGDWGAGIGTAMGKIFPQNVAGFHTNMGHSQHPRSNLKTFVGSFVPSLFYTSEEAKRFLPNSKYFVWLLRETGYMHLQATKPDTIGAGLSNSPTGLAAYLLEKFSGWTNPSFYEKADGGLTKKFNLDELLDNVMVYWVTNSITTSMRFYGENLSKNQRSYHLDAVPCKVSVGVLVPRWEGYLGQPKATVQDTFPNMLTYTYAEDGGHFFAMEHPDVLVKDYLKFVKLAEAKGNVF